MKIDKLKNLATICCRNIGEYCQDKTLIKLENRQYLPHNSSDKIEVHLKLFNLY